MKLKNLDPDINQLRSIRPLEQVISFIENPDLAVLHAVSIGDGKDVKSGFCAIEFRKLYKHPFFNNFLKSLDGKAKVIHMLKNSLQKYQGNFFHYKKHRL